MHALSGPQDPQRHSAGVDRIIARLASRQHGVVAVTQLLAAGISATAIRVRVRAGRLHRLHRGVYAVGHTALTRQGRDMAAVLACGRGAVLSHRSAAALWGFHTYDGLPEVTVRRTGARRRRGIRVHVTRSLRPAEVTTRDGLPVTTPARTLVDLGDVVAPSVQTRALERAERADLLHRTEIGFAPGRRRVVHAAHRFTRSGFERRFLRALGDWNLPLPETNQHLLGWEVDCLWRERRFVVELDHPHTHTDLRAFERDRLKQEQLEEAGYRLRRITELRFRTRPAEVRALLTRHLVRPPGGEHPPRRD